jgi:hypothetical protein
MEIQEREKLKGMALLRYMIENKKKMEAEAIEDYKHNEKLQAVVRELRASNQRKKSLRQ